MHDSWITSRLKPRLANRIASTAKWLVRNLDEVFAVRRIDIFEIILDPSASFEAMTANKIYDWQVAGYDDVLEFLQDSELLHSVRRDFLQRLNAKHFNLRVARKPDSISVVAYIAYSDHFKRISGSTYFVVKQSECIIGPYYTKASSRGTGCMTQGVLEILEAERNAGKSHAHIEIDSSNHNSRRVVEKIGGRKTKSGYRLVRVFKNEFVIPFGSLTPQFKKCRS